MSNNQCQAIINYACQHVTEMTMKSFIGGSCIVSVHSSVKLNLR